MFVPLYFFVVFLMLLELGPAFSFTNITTFSFDPRSSRDMHYGGSAAASDRGFIDLTNSGAGATPSDGASRVGRATYAKSIQIYDAVSNSVADFDTNFSIIIDGGLGPRKGDGVAFFLARADSTLPANSSGAWLGLVNQTLNGLPTTQIVAVEFDTFVNDGVDPANVQNNHIAIDINSVIHPDADAGSRTCSWDGNLNAKARVSYDSSTAILSVNVSQQSPTSPSNCFLSTTVDNGLKDVLPEFVIVGFSASTSGQSLESHWISSWNFTLKLTTPYDPPPPPITLAATPPSGTTGAGKPNDTDVPNARPPSSDITQSKKPKPVILLVVVTLVLFLSASALIVTMIYIRWRRKGGKYHKCLGFIWKNMGIDQYAARENDSVSISHDLDHLQKSQLLRCFGYEELSEATDCFCEANLLGAGGFGRVYRGVLKDTGDRVAVKRMEKQSKQGKKEFVSEVKVIGQLSHRNLVKLKGWCYKPCSHTRPELLLVYDYMEGGSLDAHLFGSRNGGDGEKLLSWSQRMVIAQDIASALLYLHEDCRQCVIHRDIKTNNIMLNSEFRALLGDFGLARMVDHGNGGGLTNAFGGTLGYMAPEGAFNVVTEKGDVYSFGMVLLEIVCGRKVCERVDGERKDSFLAELVWRSHLSGELLAMVDKRLGDRFDQEEAGLLLRLGLRCTLPLSKNRPHTRQVCDALVKKEETQLPVLPKEIPTLFDESSSSNSSSTATMVKRRVPNWWKDSIVSR